MSGHVEDKISVSYAQCTIFKCWDIRAEDHNLLLNTVIAV